MKVRVKNPTNQPQLPEVGQMFTYCDSDDKTVFMRISDRDGAAACPSCSDSKCFYVRISGTNQGGIYAFAHYERIRLLKPVSVAPDGTIEFERI